MNIKWFQNPDNVVYVNGEEFLPALSKETGASELVSAVTLLRDHPKAEEQLVRGTKRTTMKLFIPNLIFSQPLEMGENVWIYRGETYPAYCVWWPREEDGQDVS